jgi:hypothetical protein
MPTCTTASLNIACFRGHKLTRLQKLAFKIWYAANELSTIGGTNYTSVLSTTLQSDAIALFQRWDRDAMDSAELAVFYNNAVAAGASVSADPNSVVNNVRRMENISEDKLMKMLVYLECQLGRHKTYPQ